MGHRWIKVFEQTGYSELNHSELDPLLFILMMDNTVYIILHN